MGSKFSADPASRGKGGLQTKGESASTKKALSRAGNASKASAAGKKR